MTETGNQRRQRLWATRFGLTIEILIPWLKDFATKGFYNRVKLFGSRSWHGSRKVQQPDLIEKIKQSLLYPEKRARDNEF
jgi:hypothetical protein